MDLFLIAIRHPAVHVALLAFPMICVMNTKPLHWVMGDQVKKYVWLSLPVALAVAALVTAFHSLRYAMGAAVLAPYIQWIALHGLYRRFLRVHGRKPRVAQELEDSGESHDYVFRIVTSVTTVGLPLLIFAVLAKILSGGGPNVID